jgi:2-polyprenyl-3-methyl-5-hydroxy-6-metoxy-1,4-benzoquinol methylase
MIQGTWIKPESPWTEVARVAAKLCPRTLCSHSPELPKVTASHGHRRALHLRTDARLPTYRRSSPEVFEMFQIRDDCIFSLTDHGALVASGAGGSDQTPIGKEQLELLEFYYRMEPAGNVSEAAVAAALGLGAMAVGERVSHLVTAGVLEERRMPPLYDAFYPPMLYYHMLADAGKMLAYKRALEESVRPGMRVLHAGCGLGIFAIWAAQLGAGRVWGVDQRGVVRYAEELVRQNQLSNVEIIMGDIFDATLARKIGPVDLVVSEFVGDQILDEDILRKSYWLKRIYSPRIVPSAIEIFAVPVSCQSAVKKVDAYRDNVLDLQKVYGLDLGVVSSLIDNTATAPDLAERLYVHEFREYGADVRHLASPQEFIAFNLASNEAAMFHHTAPLRVEMDGHVDGVLLFFRARLHDEIYAASFPGANSHWPELLYLARRPISLRAGDTVKLSLAYLGGKRLLVAVTP